MLSQLIKNLSIGKRIGFGFGLVLLLMAVMIIPVVIQQITQVVHTAEENELRQLATSVQAELDSEARMAEAMSSLYANISVLQYHFAEGERDYLAEQLAPAFQKLRDDYAVEQFQLHTPPATSWLRVHRPDRFGDDLSTFRQTVVETNRDRRAIRGLEGGVAGLGIRGISPVIHQGRHLGSVEFGMSFGQPFFEQIKGKYGVEIGLFLPEDGGFKAFAATHDTAMASPAQLQQALGEHAIIERISRAGNEYAVYLHKTLDYSGKPVGVMEIVMDRSAYVASINHARNITIGIVAIALAISLLLSSLISYSITCPIRQAVNAMHDIADGEGDLTRRLPEEGSNEIAALAHAFNQFAAKVQGMVQQVIESVGQIHTASETQSQITRLTHQEIGQQQSETEQVATAMNEMTATVQEVASNAAHAAEAARQANQEAQEGKQVMRQTLNSMDTLVSEVERATGVIHTLEQESEQIGSVLDVIRAIAEQTNLLALNAAIEAARAGEQGRGFAVVADEVRTLASRTQSSTQEIQAMIERLQTGASNAVRAMESGREQARAGVEQAAQAGSSLDTITRSVAAINDMNMQIASAAEEQSSVAEEINRNISAINQSVENTTQGTQQLADAGQSLTQLANDLQALVGRFRV